MILDDLFIYFTCYRNISCTSRLNNDGDKKPGILNRILRGDQFDYPTNAHSVLLANQEILYKFQGFIFTLSI